MKEVAKGIGKTQTQVKKEAKELERIGVLKVGGGKKKEIKVLATFPHLSELRSLATKPFPMSRKELTKILRKAGKPRLVAVSGVFLNEPKTRVDLLYVADKLSEKRLEVAARNVEQAVGTELRWSGFDTKDFLYRWEMYDRFVRDVLTGPHEKVLDKLSLKE